MLILQSNNSIQRIKLITIKSKIPNSSSMSSSNRFQCPYCNNQYTKESYKKHMCNYAPSPLLCQHCNIPVKGMYSAFFHKKCKRSFKIIRTSPYSRPSSPINLEDVDPQVSRVSQSAASASLSNSSNSEIEFLRNRILKLESIIDNLNTTLNFILSSQVSMSSSFNSSDNLPVDPLFDINIDSFFLSSSPESS